MVICASFRICSRKPSQFSKAAEKILIILFQTKNKKCDTSDGELSRYLGVSSCELQSQVGLDAAI